MIHLNFPFEIILGSASPRRQELLKTLGFTFKVFSINANEDFPETLRSEEIPLYLAEKKSLAYPQPLHEKELLITSDTIVWHNSHVLNKPIDLIEAKKMLQSLSNSHHTVYSGVCLRTIQTTFCFVDATKVFFRKLTEEEIEFYIHHYTVLDKAGSYGAQDWIGCIGVERIEGSYFNVMGLPVHRLYTELLSLVNS